MKEDESVTSKFAYWMPPSESDNKLAPIRLADINYTKPRLGKRINESYTQMNIKTDCLKDPFRNNGSESVQKFLRELKKISPNVSILRRLSGVVVRSRPRIPKVRGSIPATSKR